MYVNGVEDGLRDLEEFVRLTCQTSLVFASHVHDATHDSQSQGYGGVALVVGQNVCCFDVCQGKADYTVAAETKVGYFTNDVKKGRPDEAMEELHLLCEFGKQLSRRTSIK